MCTGFGIFPMASWTTWRHAGQDEEPEHSGEECKCLAPRLDGQRGIGSHLPSAMPATVPGNLLGFVWVGAATEGALSQGGSGHSANVVTLCNGCQPICMPSRGISKTHPRSPTQRRTGSPRRRTLPMSCCDPLQRKSDVYAHVYAVPWYLQDSPSLRWSRTRPPHTSAANSAHVVILCNGCQPVCMPCRAISKTHLLSAHNKNSSATNSASTTEVSSCVRHAVVS